MPYRNNDNSQHESLDRGSSQKPTILPTNRIARRNTNLRLSIIAAVNMHPQHILPRPLIEQHLRPLDNAVRSQIGTPRPARQQRPLISPPHQVRRRVAVDVLERGAAALVLADHVICSVDADHACAVGVEVFPVGLLLGAVVSISGRAIGDPVLEAQGYPYRCPGASRHDLQ